MPQEELAVRILLGSGIRKSELCGLALVGPDGMSDLMLDSMVRGRVECGCAGTPAPRAGSHGGCRSRTSWRERSGATRDGIAGD
jgi:hypothetical protein